MAHICDNCDKELDRQLFCENKCRMQYVRKTNEARLLTGETKRNADKERGLNKIIQDQISEVEKLRAEIETLSSPQDRKPSKEELQAIISTIEKKPDPVVPRFAPRVSQNADGEYLNASGMSNPRYDPQEGYDDPAIEL